MKEVGILLPVFSLPSSMGVGDFGPEAYTFIDLLAENHCTIWQILPLTPIQKDHSPYNSISSFAIEPIYISLEKLVEIGLLEPFIIDKQQEPLIDYEKVSTIKTTYLKKAFQNFKKNPKYQDAFQTFIKQPWLDNYAQFVSLLQSNCNTPWNTWDLSYINIDEIDYQKFLQFIAHQQWSNLKSYAHQKGIKMIGDMPIYISYQSADVFGNPNNFLLNEQKEMEYVSGAPADCFSKTGQKWGHPLYNFSYLKAQHYQYFIDRILHLATLYDVIRFDHFRAYDSYYQIPIHKNAGEGFFQPGPSYHFFQTLFTHLHKEQMIVEDLGCMRQETIELRDDYHLTGMKIIQYTFDCQKGFDTDCDTSNKVVYTGNHDNDTIVGWYQNKSFYEQRVIDNFLKKEHCTGAIHMQWIQYILKHPYRYAIFPVQDILGLDNCAKINTPNTIENNWTWRLTSFEETSTALQELKQIIEQSIIFSYG